MASLKCTNHHVAWTMQPVTAGGGAEERRVPGDGGSGGQLGPGMAAATCMVARWRPGQPGTSRTLRLHGSGQFCSAALLLKLKSGLFLQTQQLLWCRLGIHSGDGQIHKKMEAVRVHCVSWDTETT